MAAQPEGPPTLYWSIAQPEGLVLGFSQKPSMLNPSLSSLLMPIYHRRAGGTAVLVGPDLLSLDVILPENHPFLLSDLVESYRWFGEAWVAALARLGVQSQVIFPERARVQREMLKRPETRDRELLLRRACYGSYSSYEVTVGERKVVGLDMIRRRSGSLLQAGVLLHWDPRKLALMLGHTTEEQFVITEGLYERAVGLDTLIGRSVQPLEVIKAFETVLETLL